MTETCPHDGLFAAATPELVRCPYPVYEHLRGEHPVQWIPALTAYAVTRHADILDVLLRPEDFSSRKQSGPGAATSLAVAAAEDPQYSDRVRAAAVRRIGIAEKGAALVNCDPPRHGEQRKMMNKVFTPRRVALLEPPIRELAEGLVDAFVARGEADVVAELATPLPMTVIARALGIEGTDIPTLKRWSDAFVRANGRPNLSVEEISALILSLDECYDFFEARMSERLADPREDLVTDVAQADLCHEERLQMLTLFLIGGNETTNSLIASCIWMLCRRPELQDELRADPELIPPFVEETLRVEPPVQGLFRQAMRDTTVGGVPIRAGDFLWLVYGSANRDEAQFPTPDEIRLDRGAEGRRHLSFAQGPHFCLGAPLARAEARIALETLLARTRNLALAPDEDAGQWAPNLVQHNLTRLNVVFDPVSV
ncbi:cytochrome P450 [Sporichthya brevicatena]|uniref:Cytochrome P450 n=1 Tax=Sporichthya brevicatena TaxID=171442 RepID=A0ABN1GD61_9ACTN